MTTPTIDLSAVRRAALQAARASAARDEAIRKARWDGATLRAIAEAAQLSYARIFQIVRVVEESHDYDPEDEELGAPCTVCGLSFSEHVEP